MRLCQSLRRPNKLLHGRLRITWATFLHGHGVQRPARRPRPDPSRWGFSVQPLVHLKNHGDCQNFIDRQSSSTRDRFPIAPAAPRTAFVRRRFTLLLTSKNHIFYDTVSIDLTLASSCFEYISITVRFFIEGNFVFV